MQYQSLWLDNYQDNNIHKLKEDLTLDVLIIGGGLTGLQTLYELKDTPLKIALVERNLIGHGVSGYTTGKINYLQGLIYQNILHKHGYNAAYQYYLAQIDGLNLIKDIITKEKITCDFKKVTSYVIAEKEEDIKKLQEEAQLLKTFGAPVQEHLEKIPYFHNLYGISVDDTYDFHPLKYLQALKSICLKSHKDIYEYTNIVKIKKIEDYYLCYTPNNVIKTKKIIIATHYPYFLKPYLFSLKVRIQKSYITASSKHHQNATYITTSSPISSLRYYQNYLLYLNDSWSIDTKLNEKENYLETLEKVQAFGLKPKYIWKNDDLITADFLPYIGPMIKSNSQIFIATGYNKWGISNSAIASVILKDLILEKENVYATLFNPLRINIFQDAKEYFLSIASSVKGYLQGLWKQKANAKVSFKYIDGEKIGIYEENQKYYMVRVKCPHLGCHLIFNEVDKTWDCPCHASRFTKEGICIKGPSPTNITYSKDTQD